MKYLFLLGYSLAVSAPSLAAESDAGQDTITVVATGSQIELDQTGQSISLVSGDEIASVQSPDVTSVLTRLPGVSFARSGSLGSQTSVFVRGASSEQLLVLVDGVRMNDVASPSGGYDFGNLLSGGIEKIELLRGSNSVVWGSQAIGGVLAVTTRQVDGVEASAEYGSRDSFNAQANAGISGERYSLALDGGYTRTDGVSAARTGTEPDGFRQWRLSGRGKVALAEGLAATLDARYSDNRLDIDGYPAPDYVFADTPEYQKTREASGRAGLEYSGAALDLKGGFALSDIRRAYYDPTFGSAPNYQTKGRSERADLGGAWRPVDGLRLDFGADSEWSHFSTSYDARKQARLSSAHALLGWYGDRLSLAAGVRLDDHSRFGSEWTFGANGSFSLDENWRVRASYGEGFKAPTLFQLYSDYGNTTLVPERSRSYDIGIERGDRNGPLHIAVTAFRRDSRNLIDYVSCFGVTSGICEYRPYGTYDNVGKARAEGVEVELGAQVSERFHAQAVYSYVKAVNRMPGDANQGNDLARRPRNTVTVSADWRTPLHDLVLGADVRMVDDSYDDAGNFTRLGGYAVATLRASLPVTERIELFGRVENVTDEKYETAAGYNTPGRSAYFGARARF